jgi:VCBS repeat-containing protein
MASTSSAGWVTRIGSFKFGSANQPPVAGADAYTTAEDTPLSVSAPGVLANDSDPNGGTLSVTGNTQPAHGTATVNANGSFTYTPAANYNGADSFTYTLSDGQGGTATGTVNLTVTPVNDPPTANPQTVSTQSGTPLAITLTGSDVDGNPLTYAVATQPAHGTLSGTAPNLTYTPAAGYTGADSFTFTVNDGTVDSAAATVSITVGSADVVWLSLTTNASLSGLGTVNDEDIVALDKATGVYTWVFDGSDVGISGDIDAFDVLDNGHILMSFDANQSVTGLGTVADADVVEFTPASLGATTSGTFAWKFDASDVGLSTANEDVDALHFMNDGSMVVSTRGSFGVTGITGANADLIRFAATAWGSTTSGTWSFYFDASDVGLSASINENVDGTWLDETVTPHPSIYLSTVGSFGVTGVSGQNEDIFVFRPTTLGATTSGTYNSTLYLDGSLFGLGNQDVDALDVRR